MLASKCAKCGKHFVGWALSIPENQKCPQCGSRLAIHDDTVDLELDYGTLMQSRDSSQKEWHKLLEKTMTLCINREIPCIISAN